MKAGKEKQRGFTMTELLVVVAIVVALVAIGVPVVRNAVAGSQRVGCLNQLKGIGVGLELYLDDHNDLYPEIAMAGRGEEEELTLEGVLAEYLTEPEAFRCPADKRLFEETGSSYLWNSTQSGRHRMQTSFFGTEGEPEKVPLVLDKEAFHGEWQGVNMLYADYHTSKEVEFDAGPSE